MPHGGHRRRHVPPALAPWQVANIIAERATKPRRPMKVIADEYGVWPKTIYRHIKRYQSAPQRDLFNEPPQASTI
jgi:hypothetical protein